MCFARQGIFEAKLQNSTVNERRQPKILGSEGAMFHQIKFPLVAPLEKSAEQVDCPLCGSARYSLLLKAAAKKGENEFFDIVECKVCGFKFTNPRPTMTTISVYYGEDYYSYQRPSQNVNLWDESASDKLTYLDYGCGAGHKLIEKINQGYSAYGVELDEQAREIGHQLGLDIRQAYPDCIDFADNFFDEIHINNVLEHLHKPVAILSEAYRCLKEGGRLWIEVPNVESYDSKLFGNLWRHLDVPLHLNHFGPDTLKSLILKCGFEYFIMNTYHVPVFDSKLHYVRGLYTTMKIKFHTERGTAIFRACKSAWFVLTRLFKYIGHKRDEHNGNMLQVIAVK